MGPVIARGCQDCNGCGGEPSEGDRANMKEEWRRGRVPGAIRKGNLGGKVWF